MPNTVSAIRRTKKTKLQTSVNKIRKGKYKSTIKQMSNFIDAGKVKEAKDFFPKFNSQLMKIAKTGLIDRKTVSRKISRISKKIKKIKS
jgi:small subunit ribosomal protein S20